MEGATGFIWFRQPADFKQSVMMAFFSEFFFSYAEVCVCVCVCVCVL